MLTLTDVQQVALSIQPVDAAGNPASVDGVPQWTVSDPALLDILASADGLSAVLSAKGPLGDAQVIVSADANLGPGVMIITITGTLEVSVVASEAVSIGITAETPKAK